MGLAFMIDPDREVVFLGKLVPGGFMPSEDMGYLMVNIQLPDAASTAAHRRMAKKVEGSSEPRGGRIYVTAVPPDSACSPTACHPMPVSFSSRSRTGACGSRPPTSWWRNEPGIFHGRQRGPGICLRPPAHSRTGQWIRIHHDDPGPGRKQPRITWPSRRPGSSRRPGAA
jgi:hypothetical protein